MLPFLASAGALTRSPLASATFDTRSHKHETRILREQTGEPRAATPGRARTALIASQAHATSNLIPPAGQTPCHDDPAMGQTYKPPSIPEKFPYLINESQRVDDN